MYLIKFINVTFVINNVPEERIRRTNVQSKFKFIMIAALLTVKDRTVPTVATINNS